jgi:hypothetical protein
MIFCIPAKKAGSCTPIDRAIAQRPSGLAQGHAAGIGEHDRCNPSTGGCPSEAVQRIRWSFIALDRLGTGELPRKAAPA